MVSFVDDYTALISGYSWSAIGAPTVLTYSFETALDSDAAARYGAAAARSFAPFDSDQIATTEQALDDWAATSGLSFVAVAPGEGDIRFNTLDFSTVRGNENSAGFAFFPSRVAFSANSDEYGLGGDVFIAADASYYELIAHEIGHALGLDHPFEGEVQLTAASDNGRNTLMSYNTTGRETELGTFDGQVAEYLYGPSTFAPSATGGILTFEHDALAMEVVQLWGDAASEILGTSLGDRIIAGAGDDVLGGFRGDDHLEGEEGDDLLLGGGGNDFLFGGAGIDSLFGEEGRDTAHFAGFADASTIDRFSGADAWIVRSEGEQETLYGIEQLSFLDGLYVDGNGAAVARLYDTLLGRDADREGLADGTDRLDRGETLIDLAGALMTTEESGALYGGLDDTAFVTRLFATGLDRAPAQAELDQVMRTLGEGGSRAAVAVGVSESAEHAAKLASGRLEGMTWVADAEAEAVGRLYSASLDRQPDEEGLRFWIEAREDGLELADMADSFAQSEEFATRYGAPETEGYIDQLYLNVLDRPADAEGQTFWIGVLDSGALDRGDMLLAFSDSPENTVATDAVWDDGIMLA